MKWAKNDRGSGIIFLFCAEHIDKMMGRELWAGLIILRVFVKNIYVGSFDEDALCLLIFVECMTCVRHSYR